MIRKRLMPFGGVCVLLVGGTVLTTTARAHDHDDDDVDVNDSRIIQGYKISPVQLNLRGKNKLLVGLGSYFVNAAGACNDCHTQTPYKDGGNPFLGQPEMINADHYLAGGQCFGPFRSRNITPDSTGKPAGLTFPDFLKVIRTGTDEDKLHPPLLLLQVMMIEETKRNRIQEDARMEEAEALQKAFMNKLGRDYRKLQDKNSEPARDEQ